MSRTAAEVCGAPISAGARQDTASAAAQAVAGYDARFSRLNVRMQRLEAGQRLLPRMTGTNVAIAVAVLPRLLVH